MILEIERTIPLQEVLDGILTAEQMDELVAKGVEFTYIIDFLIDSHNEISGEPITTEEVDLLMCVCFQEIKTLTIDQINEMKFAVKRSEEKWFAEYFNAEALVALMSWEEGQAAERDEEGTIDLTLTVRAD